jgi:hypothetical protein
LRLGVGHLVVLDGLERLWSLKLGVVEGLKETAFCLQTALGHKPDVKGTA